MKKQNLEDAVNLTAGENSGEGLNVTRHIILSNATDPLTLYGVSDTLLRILENAFPQVVFLVRDREIHLTGPSQWVRLAQDVLKKLESQVREGQSLNPQFLSKFLGNQDQEFSASAFQTDGDYGKKQVDSGLSNGRARVNQGLEVLRSQGKSIRPQTPGQIKYAKAIAENTVVFAIGPAGTGKTYLAMAQAVASLKRGDVNRIILTRPAVEAGESLGFLPGTLFDKIDPYLRPLYDALRDMIEPVALSKLMEAGTIEVAPLAYMRGRTLNDAFIILDEAQNTTSKQMKMFLTRLGFNSKVVVTGDVTQIDLSQGRVSGLQEVRNILFEVPDIAFCHLGVDDVVRHNLVSQVIAAYSRWDETHDRAQKGQEKQ